ncbi:UNKNOWN [Stylonychia lemnae]|uniref:Uncharacterized protein n=1 Tax=Stylonychia lemnae TaxID=5949 RepID=A0A078AXJ9_STYLE|nr:UNKNOWN [Stylonychia lemnae]|eukprot:CDW87190.1 UNKNOWN [Stylonychia lemnae]
MESVNRNTGQDDSRRLTMTNLNLFDQYPFAFQQNGQKIDLNDSYYQRDK